MITKVKIVTDGSLENTKVFDVSVPAEIVELDNIESINIQVPEIKIGPQPAMFSADLEPKATIVFKKTVEVDVSSIEFNSPASEKASS